MALPMDEQRILEEMERVLAADDPKLAARLAAFGQPGFGQVLRTRRARATLYVMLLILIAAVAAVIYLMTVLRPSVATGGQRHQPSHSASAPAGKAPQTRVSAGSQGGISAGPGVSKCAATYAPACRPRWNSISPGAGSAQQNASP
ncbi:MAG: DUF3040 domain-containing protein [Streptosporangiaceae bacterium]